MKSVAIIGDFLRQPRPLVEDIVRAVVSVALPLTELQDAATRIILDVINPRTIKRADRITPSNPEGYVTVGLNEASGRGEILMELRRIHYVPNKDEEGTIKDLSSEERINLMIDTAVKVACGVRNFVQHNTIDDVEFCPALEFHQLYDRDVPEESWPSRWQAAAAGLNDEDNILAALKRSDRMVALKNSRIWQALGDGMGGYDDAMGNPWPPFAFNSGFDVDSISRVQAIELGLLATDEVAEPAKLPASNEIAEKLATKFRQYLAKLENEEQNRRNNPLTFGTSDELLDLAYEKLDPSEKLTPECIQEIKSLVEKAIERGISAEDESLIEIYEAINEPEKAVACHQATANRQVERVRAYGEGYFLIEEAENLFKSAQELSSEISKQLIDLVEKAFEKGIGAQFNLQARARKLLMEVYDRLQEPEKAESNRQQYIENASGFMLLNDAQTQLENLGKQIDLETGTKILDMLTKAVQRIPEDCSDKHAEAYRATAEVLEAIGDITHAIEYYEFALQKNPKIHVNRRLNSLKTKNVSKPTA